MRRHFLMIILMVIIGVFLLLPGVCALFFMAAGGFRDPDFLIRHAVDRVPARFLPAAFG